MGALEPETFVKLNTFFITVYTPVAVLYSQTKTKARQLDGGHTHVLVLISEVWGGFSPEAMRFLGELYM